MPVDMVRGLYEDYADKFDESLKKLHYRTPELLRDLMLSFLHSDQGLAQQLPSAHAHTTPATPATPAPLASQSESKEWPRWRRALDLGCGTGLSGIVLRPLVGVLEGVDLSAAMV